MLNYVLAFLAGFALGYGALVAIQSYLNRKAGAAMRAPLIAGGGGTGEEQPKAK